MTVVSAFLVPGSPLPYLRQDNAPWQPLAAGYEKVREALQASRPDALLIYSTQWFAVLDQLWQARPHLTGEHVDENWYEYGDLTIDLRSDTDLVDACIAGCADIGIRAKGVNYDHFPVDTGTIVANNFVNPGGKIPLVIAANNLYHGPGETEKLAAMAVEQADKQGKRLAVLAIGGLSAAYFDEEIDIAEDRIRHDADDAANRQLLDALANGDRRSASEALGRFNETTKADMGMKHLSWLFGATGDFKGAQLHAYGPTYGAGAAVVEFNL